MKRKIEESQREWNEWSAANPPVPTQPESVSNLIVAIIVIPMVIFIVWGIAEKNKWMLLVGILLFNILWYCLLFPSDILI